MQNNEKPATKPKKLAEIIYEAVIRYAKAKKTLTSRKERISPLTFPAIGGEIGNIKFDCLENDMGLANTKQDLSVIKQVAALQSMKNAELETVWHKFFNHPPEVASRQYMMAKLA